MAIFSLISSPNLKEPCFLSLMNIRGTFLEDTKLGRCLISHLGLQSEATRMTFKAISFESEEIKGGGNNSKSFGGTRNNIESLNFENGNLELKLLASCFLLSKSLKV